MKETKEHKNSFLNMDIEEWYQIGCKKDKEIMDDVDNEKLDD